MRPRPIADLIGVAAMATSALSLGPVPSAHAAGCPDVEVVFARGTTEDPGVGPTGQAFVDALRKQVGPRSLGVYPVDYPATTDFPTAVDGINDASRHITTTVANCPKTAMVLGGYSQGAAVMGFVTDDSVPDGVTMAVPQPMPPDVSNHVAAVALFGKPNGRFMRVIGQPLVSVGPQYAGKTIDLCVPDDLICASDGRDFNAHNDYVEDGMVDQAAVFAAGRVNAMAPAGVPAAPPPPAAPAPPAAPLPPAATPAPGAPPAHPAPGPLATLTPPAPAAPPVQVHPAPGPAAPATPPGPGGPPPVPPVPVGPMPPVLELLNLLTTPTPPGG